MLQYDFTCFKTAKEKPLTLSEIDEWPSMPYLYSQQVSFLSYHYDKFLISVFKHKMYTVFLLSVVAIQYNTILGLQPTNSPIRNAVLVL